VLFRSDTISVTGNVLEIHEMSGTDSENEYLSGIFGCLTTSCSDSGASDESDGGCYTDTDYESDCEPGCDDQYHEQFDAARCYVLWFLRDGGPRISGSPTIDAGLHAHKHGRTDITNLFDALYDRRHPPHEFSATALDRIVLGGVGDDASVARIGQEVGAMVGAGVQRLFEPPASAPG